MQADGESGVVMIEFKSVSKIYLQGQRALQNICFKVDRGDFVFLTGHSGAGKTSVLRLIALIERVSMGNILFNGEDVTDLPLNRIPYYRRHIGMIFQDHHLMMNRTVAENTALPLLIQNYSMEESMERVSEVLERVGLKHKENCYPVYLSTGEQQRVGIARAIIGKPDVLLADEPTGNLDKELSLEILSLFESLNNDGTTVIMASHDIDLLKNGDHRVISLQNGHLIYDGNTDDFTGI